MTSVTVRLSETYDLHTQVGKLGLIGIHTPSGALIDKYYGGLFSNFSHISFGGCDVEMACASVMPADPLQIGFTEGSVDPRDLFNPILATAVSNDSMSMLLDRIYTNPALGVADLTGESVTYIDDANTFVDANGSSVTRDAYKIYYAFLSEGKMKASMPQAGVSLRHLVPVVRPVAVTREINNVDFDDNNGNPGFSNSVNANGDLSSSSGGLINNIVSLAPVRMPAVPTASFDKETGTYSKNTYLLPVYVGAILTPPAYRSLLYYRMTVTWTITFSGLRSALAGPSIGLSSIANIGNSTYRTDYDSQSATMTASEDLVDTTDMSLEKAFTKVY